MKQASTLLLASALTLACATREPSAPGPERPGPDEEQSEPEPAPEGLVGTYFELVSVGEEPALQEGPLRPAYLKLEPDGSFRGSGGINLLRGSYTLEGRSLGLSPGPMTRMAGDPVTMDQEDRFLRALAGVTTCTLADGRLTLLAGDEVQLVLRAAPEPL